ncbi:acyltransferase [Xanthobacteraceae bacterium A53D]
MRSKIALNKEIGAAARLSRAAVNLSSFVAKLTRTKLFGHHSFFQIEKSGVWRAVRDLGPDAPRIYVAASWSGPTSERIDLSNGSALAIFNKASPPKFSSEDLVKVSVLSPVAIWVTEPSDQRKLLRSGLGGVDIGVANAINVPANWDAVSSHIQIEGSDNYVYIGEGARIGKASIRINGSGNVIYIDDGCSLKGSFSIQGDRSALMLSRAVRFTSRNTQFSVQENNVSICLGEGCLIGETKIRTSDSHSIIDLESGQRINPARSVSFGDRVWAAQGVRILRGVSLAADTIVAAGSIVTKPFDEPNTIVGGVPAKVIRRGVRWDTNRIAMDAAE